MIFVCANPLVAERQDTTTPLAGTFLLEDGEALKEAIESKSWVAGGLAVVSGVADTVAAVSDPIGTLFAMGFGWLLDHVQPFTRWLEELTGDADQVRAHAATWKNVEKQMVFASEMMTGYVDADLAGMSGQTIEAYRGAAGDVAKAVAGAGGWAGAMGTALEVTAFIVQFVHDYVRDAISEVVGSILSYLIELAATGGLALPLVLEQIATRVSSLITGVARNVENLVNSARNLVKKLGELKDLFKRLGDKLGELFRKGGSGEAPRGDKPPGKTRADGDVDGNTGTPKEPDKPVGRDSQQASDPNRPGYDTEGKPLKEDRGDGKMHYANDPEGTFREKDGKLRNSDGGYANDPYSKKNGKMPEKGEPNSYGYDANGDLLPYANHRPDYAPGQVEEVWTNSRNQQIADIKSGKMDLEMPGPNQMWVKTVDDAKQRGIDVDHVDADGANWRLVEWKPGDARQGNWDMGHMPDKKYSELRDKYLSGKMSTEEFLAEYRNADNYRVEDPARNRSHADEK